MVRQARDLVRSGALGEVRLIDGELRAGDPGVTQEPEDPTKRHWRLRAASTGKGAIMGEFASHAYHIVSYVTGLKVEQVSVEQVSAELSTFAEGREVYGNSHVTARLEGVARGRIWRSFMASGNDHGLSFRNFGEWAGLTWHQEEPEILWFNPIGKPAVRMARGYDGNSGDSLAGSRFCLGHPEGNALACADTYSDFTQAIMYRKLGRDPSVFLNRTPGISDGVSVIALIEAAFQPYDNDGNWTDALGGTN